MRKNKVLFVLVAMLLSVQCIYAQSVTVKGRVVDASSQEALIGVTVAEVGTVNGTFTDLNGEFTLTVESSESQLEFTYVGYQSFRLAVGNSTNLNIELNEETIKLDDVVIVAYGTSTKREVTGAVADVSLEDLEANAFSSIDLALQGEVTGLQVISSSGQPGAESVVRLRGIGSITAGSDPLYVVDGIPINSGYIGNRGITWTSNSLAGINAEDIESISILKDASATSLYGSRGGNGVILITTKKGRAGKTSFNFSSNVGVNSVGLGNNIPQPLNAAEFAELTNEGLLNAGFTQADADNILDALGANNGADTDWFDVVTQNGLQMSYDLSASGGNEKTQFFLSGGYFSQEGVTIGSKFERFSGSVSMDHRASSRLSFNTKVLFSSSKQETPFQSAFFSSPASAIYILNPFQEPYDSNGDININPMDFPQTFNPVAINELDDIQFKNNKLIATLGLDFKIIDGLIYSFKAGIDVNQTTEKLYFNPFYGNALVLGGYSAENATDLSNWNVLNMLSYEKKFLDDESLELKAKAGFEFQESRAKSLGASAVGFPPNTSIQTLTSAGTPQTAFSERNEYTFQSILSDVSLSWRSKYTLSGSLRRDGSSRFGSNNRYGVFYSVGASWFIKDENFLRDVDFISSLRLRSSYGRTGNANIPNYAWRPTYSYGFTYNGIPGSAPNNPGNPDLTWEKNNAFDVGIDGGILNDRVFLSFDYYIRKTTDLLLDVPVSLTTGFETTLENVGEMVNKGVELGISAHPIVSSDFDWKVQLNISHNKNKVLKLYEGQDIITVTNTGIIREEEDVQSYYLPLWAGVNPQTGEPLWYTDETRSETTSNFAEASPVATGTVAPTVYGALTNALSWEGIEVTFQFNYSFGGQLYDRWAFLLQSDGAIGNANRLDLQLDRWQQEGDVTDVPQYIWNNSSGSNSNSTRFLYESDYIRLRHVRLAYDFPFLDLEKVHMSKLKIYVEATNLWTWVKDDRIYFDPDLAGTQNRYNGVSDFSLPVQKTIAAGINIGF